MFTSGNPEGDRQTGDWAGIALLGVITASLASGMQDAAHRTAAGITFLVAASGVSFAGIGSAFWALVAGMLVWWVLRKS